MNMKKVSMRVLSFIMAMAIVIGMICINKADVDAASTANDGTYYVCAFRTKTFAKRKGYLVVKMETTSISKSGEYRNVNRTELKAKISKKCKFYFKQNGSLKRTTFKKIQKRVQYNRKMSKKNFMQCDTMLTQVIIKNGQVVKIIFTKGFVGAS